MTKNDLLKWQVEMGADEAIDENTSNQFEKKTPEKKAASIVNEVKTSEIKASTPIISPQSAKTATRLIAENAKNLDELREAVNSFKGLSITKTATNTVFSDGNPTAKIMMVGEAPGAEEDAQGIPFCGASGKMLDQMFSYIGLERTKNFYITNTVFWRPPGNRRPTPEELAVCLPFVEKHISLIKPKLIILVGGTAIASLMDSNVGITKMRGQFYDYSNCYLDKPIKTTAVFHPSYLLRSPGQKRIAWKDLLMLKEYMSKEGLLTS